jgi:hypothetical protein
VIILSYVAEQRDLRVGQIVGHLGPSGFAPAF